MMLGYAQSRFSGGCHQGFISGNLTEFVSRVANTLLEGERDGKPMISDSDLE